MCGLSVLAKGLAGLGLPVIVFVAYLAFTGNWRRLNRAQLRYGIIVSLVACALVAVPWHHAMLIRHGGAFWNELFGDNHWRRMVIGRHGDRGTFEYFVRELGYGLLPWIALVPAALGWAVLREPSAAAAVRGRRRGRDAQAGHHPAGRDLVRRRLRAGVDVDDEVPPLRAARDSGHGDRRRLLPRRADQARRLAARGGGGADRHPAAGAGRRWTSPTRKSAAQKFLWLFSYDYVHNKSGRPWPDRLDFSGALIGFCAAFAVATAALVVPRIRRWAGGRPVGGRDRVHVLPAGRVHARGGAIVVAEGADRGLLREPPLAGRAADRVSALLARRDLLHVERDLRGAAGGADGVRSGGRRREAEGLDVAPPRPARPSSCSSGTSRRACRGCCRPRRGRRSGSSTSRTTSSRSPRPICDGRGRGCPPGSGGAAATVHRGGRRAARGGRGSGAARGDPGERRVPARAAAGGRRRVARGWPPIPACAAPKPPEAIAREVRAAAAGAADLAELQRRLRRVRRYEMLRLGARELGWGTTDEVARELSAFADACLDVAVEVCDARAAPRAGRAARRRRRARCASSSWRWASWAARS